MNITYENFITLQPEGGSDSRDQRFWNILLLSLLLHLIILELLIEHYPPFSVSPQPTVIPNLSITINNPRTVAPAKTASPPATPVQKPVKTKRQDRIKQRATPRTSPLAVPSVPVVVLPAQHEQKSTPKAGGLIKKSLDYAAKTGKQMEARIGPDIFMTKTNRDMLIKAMSMQEQQDPAMSRWDKQIVAVSMLEHLAPGIYNPAQLQVYNNQYGDLVYQTGDSCAAIPAVLVPFTFKQINSIMATPVSCGGDNQESTFSLK